MIVRKKFERDAQGALQRASATMTFGIIVANRSGGVKPLVDEGREAILQLLGELGYNTYCLTAAETDSGSVGCFNDAKKCAELFKAHANEIDGVIVTMPNFGDERPVAEALRMADLKVPVLIQAEPDVMDKMDVILRRDSFCGKISLCNNLKQYNIPISLTKNHCCAVLSDEFKGEVSKFAAICRVVDGVKTTRIGAIGVRPAGFATVRYSEKILQRLGVTVEPIDLSEIMGMVNKLDAPDRVAQKVEEVQSYVPFGSDTPPEGSMDKIAKLLIVLEDWIEANDLDAIAFQCWTSVEQYLGIAPCGVLSMLTNKLIPSACEVDVSGALTMLVFQYASQKPSVLLDWDNNYAEELDKCIVFHCSNIGKDFLEDPKLVNHASPGFQPDNGFGAIFGKLKPAEVTFAGINSVDWDGELQYYIGQGRFTDDELQTFGGYGVLQVENLQQLLHKICECGFEHHFTASVGDYKDVVVEAFEKYLGIRQPCCCK